MNRSIGGFVLYIATALFLLASGVGGIFFGRNGGLFYAMVSGIFGGGSLTTIISIVFAVCAIAAGVMLLLQLFGVEFGIIEILLIAFVILWALFILVADIINPLRTHPGFWEWLQVLALHLIVLGALITSTKTIGGQ